VPAAQVRERGGVVACTGRVWRARRCSRRRGKKDFGEVRRRRRRRNITTTINYQ